MKLEQLEVAKELVKGQTDAWFEFYIDSDGHDGMSLCCSGCLPPAVSRRADCRCDEPSEGVHVTRSTALRHSWPPDVDHGLPGVGVSAENRGGVIGRRVENGGILSPEAVASGERERDLNTRNALMLSL